MTRRINCPLPAYPSAWVDLPDEWLGAHLLKRDAGIRAATKYGNDKLVMFAISLCVADGWDGIPGLVGRDPAQWDFGRVPLSIIAWLEEAVFDDFSKAFTVPKASSPPPPGG